MLRSLKDCLVYVQGGREVTVHPDQYTPQTQTYSEGSRKLTRISIAVPYSYHSGTVYVVRYM
jgi:hypothetical protein